MCLCKLAVLLVMVVMYKLEAALVLRHFHVKEVVMLNCKEARVRTVVAVLW